MKKVREESEKLIKNTVKVREITIDRIAEGLTLHDVLPTPASWGIIAGYCKLKIM